MKKYWRDYYEMNQEHEQIVEELYLKKMTNDSFLLDAVQKEKLMEFAYEFDELKNLKIIVSKYDLEKQLNLKNIKSKNLQLDIT